MEEKKDPIKDLIEKSGNSFHYEVVKFLREREWSVLISPYYNDNITDKPREIDIIAEKAPITNLPGSADKRRWRIRLFIECKYINNDIVFWFDKKDEEKAKKRIIAGTAGFLQTSDLIKHHYYTGKQVAKLFASGGNKLQDNEIIYKALNQSLNAMFSSSTDSAIYRRTTNYSLILCNSFKKLYKVDLEKGEEYSQISENYFQLEVNYAYLDKEKNRKSDCFLIDIIDFNKFDEFLRMLEAKDIKAIQNIFISKMEKVA